MTAHTTNYSLPYPELSDVPDGATETENLAVAIDTALFPACQAFANTAAVTTPVTNQIIYDLSTSIFKRWTGSAWQDLMPGDTGSHSHEAEWVTTGSQSVATNTATTILWTASPVTSADITVSAGTITTVRGGLWHFSFFVVTNVPTTISQVVCSRLLDHTSTAIMGSGARSCTGDNGYHRAAAGDTFTVSHTQQTGTSGTAAGFFKAAWVRG